MAIILVFFTYPLLYDEVSLFFRPSGGAQRTVNNTDDEIGRTRLAAREANGKSPLTLNAAKQ
ncbi:hypothetical protein K7H99_20985 (plasmid) [Providencia rettgeri]|uniref:hypothetical protein n=1 Tax=Providencia rettgeri TaxID=587 RepID=UPI001CA7321D|nr:hypothetical protein K7H99_20985 [Providencia rettgeri]